MPHNCFAELKNPFARLNNESVQSSKMIAQMHDSETTLSKIFYANSLTVLEVQIRKSFCKDFLLVLLFSPHNKNCFKSFKYFFFFSMLSIDDEIAAEFFLQSF